MNVHIDFRKQHHRTELEQNIDINNYRTTSEIQKDTSPLLEVRKEHFIHNQLAGVISLEHTQSSLSRDDMHISRHSNPSSHVDDEIRRIQLEAERKEQNLRVTRFF